MNSLVIVLFLSGMVAMIMLRTLHKDIARYNQMDSVVSLVIYNTVRTYSTHLQYTPTVIYSNGVHFKSAFQRSVPVRVYVMASINIYFVASFLSPLF